jgi:hypothetical protein
MDNLLLDREGSAKPSKRIDMGRVTTRERRNRERNRDSGQIDRSRDA